MPRTMPDHRQEGAEDRRPDHNLRPERTVASQSGQVEPMRHGAEPVPEPLRRRGPQDDLAVRAGNVDGRSFRIAEVEAMERPSNAGGGLRSIDPRRSARRGGSPRTRRRCGLLLRATIARASSGPMRRAEPCTRSTNRSGLPARRTRRAGAPRTDSICALMMRSSSAMRSLIRQHACQEIGASAAIRSGSLSVGNPTYIMTMPDPNHIEHQRRDRDAEVTMGDDEKPPHDARVRRIRHRGGRHRRGLPVRARASDLSSSQMRSEPCPGRCRDWFSSMIAASSGAR